MVTRTRKAEVKMCATQRIENVCFSHQYYFARSDFLRYHYKNIFKIHCVQRMRMTSSEMMRGREIHTSQRNE